MRGQLAAVLGLPGILRKRRAIQAARRVQVSYIESILTPI
jgi:hypothetical protein